MATPRWIGAALDVAQKDLVTIANTWATGDTLLVTINGRDLVLTVGTTATTAGVATALKEMWNGETFTDTTHSASETGDNVPEFAEATASVNGSVVTLTGNTKGKPFILTATEVTAGTGTAVRSAGIACTGKNWWDNVDNWDTGVLPADADTVYFDNSDVSVLYGLDQNAIDPAALYIAMTYTGDIGLPEINTDGEAYHEYRNQYLIIGPVILQIGAGAGNGSGRIKINSGSDPCAFQMLNSGASADEQPAVLWKGTNVGNTLVMRGGSLGIGVFGGEAATLATFTVHAGGLTLGASVTLSGALQINGGVLAINSLVDTSLTVNGGSVVIDGTANVDLLVIRGGTVVYNTSGTLGGATIVSGDGVLDFSQDSRAVTVSAAIDLHGRDCRLLDPVKRLGAVVVDLNEGASLAQIDLGQNLRVTRGTPA